MVTYWQKIVPTALILIATIFILPTETTASAALTVYGVPASWTADEINIQAAKMRTSLFR